MDTLRRSLSRWKKYHIKVHLAEDDVLLPLTVRPTDNMMDLRAHLVREGVTSWKKSFHYNARQLEEHETVKEAKIQNGSVVLLITDKRSWARRRRGRHRGVRTSTSHSIINRTGFGSRVSKVY